MATRTADNLVEAIRFGRPAMIGLAAINDFGINLRTLPAYENAILKEGLTAEQLHEHAGDDAWLTKTLGITIKTIWSMIPPEE